MEHSLSPVKMGEQDRSADLSGFILTETVRAAGSMLPNHYHQHANIALVLKGTFIETVGRRPYEVDSRSLILRPAGEMHADRYGREEARSLIIEVRPHREEMINQASDILSRAAHLKDSAFHAAAQRIRSEFRLMDDASPLAVESLILELLAQAARRNSTRPSTRPPRLLHEARDFIHARFAQTLSLSDIAQAVGAHPSHIAKMFRRHYRCTAGEYLRRLRLDFAAQTLAESDETLSEIALAAGFYDQSHFTRTFKLRFGFTPSEYRKSARADKARTKRQ